MSRQVRAFIASAVALVATAFVVSVAVQPAGADITVDEPAALVEARETLAYCQRLQAISTSGTARYNRARTCVADAQAVINSYAVTPTPTSSPTPTATASPTPTPTATPTPTPTGTLTNCFTQLAACGYPHPGNTGVPSGVTLAAYSGNLTITTAGTVIDGKTLGCVVVKATGVVIRNSRIVGPCFYGVEMVSGSLTIEDSEIDCVTYQGTGVAYSNFTATRLHVRRCENGFHTGSNSLIQDSYIAEVSEVNDGHGDGIQGSSGSNFVVRHNTFNLNNPITSSIIWHGLTMSDVLVENNFFAAGAYTTYCPPGGSNVVYRNNRYYGPVGNWGADPHRPAYGYTDGCGRSGITWTGNYRDDTLAAI